MGKNVNLSDVGHFLQPQESEEVEPVEPLEDETKIPMSDTAEDYYYDQYDGTRGFILSLFSASN